MWAPGPGRRCPTLRAVADGAPPAQRLVDHRRRAQDVAGAQRAGAARPPGHTSTVLTSRGDMASQIPSG
ncbi:hypothetical protein I546_5942 [Mycobacterium kansasii 732]|nr:hypothetical protein I546_5942 [Mycobacterium kansasii 732]